MSAAGDWINKVKYDASGDAVLSAFFTSLADSYDRRLWHQLTNTLEELVALPQWEQGDFLLQLYENFVKSCAEHLNQLRLAQLLITISAQHKDLSARIAFLQKAAANITEPTPSILLRCEAGKHILQQGNIAEAKKLFVESEEQIESLTGVEPAVYASYYLLSASIQKLTGTAADFYKDILLYLAYVPLNTVSASRQHEISFDVCLSALIGDNVYNFGELLSHPILAVLAGTDDEWIVALLRAFNNGDIAKYGELQNTYAKQMSAQPTLVKNKVVMEEKIAILALMELVFGLPAGDRVVSFDTIAAATQLAADKVELLVMRALSQKLIEGIIDQVARTVQVTRVAPRVLDLEQVAGLRNKFDGWLSKINETHKYLEGEIPELLA
mmetsp:Transcript_17394/g.67587  ORF Transcript_17394/g.67587 Transcript_17394/m.67587 type:complete len:384 (+) Transcript_17394:135-1286(+)